LQLNFFLGSIVKKLTHIVQFIKSSSFFTGVRVSNYKARRENLFRVGFYL